jgi:hypothetical protein
MYSVRELRTVYMYLTTVDVFHFYLVKLLDNLLLIIFTRDLKPFIKGLSGAKYFRQ